MQNDGAQGKNVERRNRKKGLQEECEPDQIAFLPFSLHMNTVHGTGCPTFRSCPETLSCLPCRGLFSKTLLS